MKRLAWFLALSLFMLPQVHGEAQAASKSPDTLIYAAQADVLSLDPAAADDDASRSVLAVLYDRLIDYDGTALDRFVPRLAVEVPTAANGGISRDGLTYTFKVRPGVKFHNGYPLSADDVAYSYRRIMITDPEGGPGWIWYRALLSTAGSRGADGKIEAKFPEIEACVKASGDTVTFSLAHPYPAFLSVLAGGSASVVSRKWVQERGGWDGTAKGWEKYNNPAPGKETLADVANGTGSYRLARWTRGSELVVERFDASWAPRPALRSGIRRVVEDASQRKRMLLEGEVDMAAVDPMDAAMVSGLSGARGVSILKDLPAMRLEGLHWNMAIEAKDNPCIGSGKMDGQGIPSEFFADNDVRQGFLYAWDGKAFLKEAFPGGIEASVPIPRGLADRNDGLRSGSPDLAKAAQSLKKAHSGQVWENGFRMDLVYDEGNAFREAAVKALARNLNAVNSKFQVNVRAVEWIRYRDLAKKRKLPVVFLSWAADAPDADDFLYPYMHSQGTFAARLGYKNTEADKLVMGAASEPDPAKRKAAYFKLQDLWTADPGAILLGQATAVRAMRDALKGYEYHPMEGEPFSRLPSLRKQ